MAGINENPYTPKQRKALHLWLSQVAETLNAAGLDMKKTLKPSAEIPWTLESAKNFLYRPIMETMTGKESTEDQTTIEPTIICDTIARHLGEKFGVELPPFPDRFSRQ